MWKTKGIRRSTSFQWPKVQVEGASLLLLACALGGVACMAYGSIYQKRFPDAGDAWTRTALMFVGATVPAAVGVPILERGHIQWTPPMIAIYAWSLVALAVGATMGLLFLIERGHAARAASLIYLVPPTSALMAYFGFGETLTFMQIVGFAISAMGVALVQLGSSAQHSG